MSETSKIGAMKSQAAVLLSNLKANLQSPSKIWGRTVNCLSTLQQLPANFENTLRNFAKLMQREAHSFAEGVSEELSSLKPAALIKGQGGNRPEKLLSATSIDKWLEGGTEFSDTQKEQISGQAEKYDESYGSLKNLVRNQPLTRAVIRNHKLSSEEALAIHTKLNSPQFSEDATADASDKSRQDSENTAQPSELSDNESLDSMDQALQNGLEKLPSSRDTCFLPVTYGAGRKFAVNDPISFPASAVASKVLTDARSDQAIFIINSKQGKSVCDLSNSSEKDEVMFPQNVKLKIKGSSVVAGQLYIELVDQDSETLPQQSTEQAGPE